jgi:hypothetical protein
MLTAEAQIDTEHPSRYLAQLRRHAAAMGGARGHRLRAHAGAQAGREVQVHAKWSEADGAISFDPWGTCTITASADRLVLRAEAADEENLRRIQDVLTRDIDRFGRRERLTITWHCPKTPGAERGEEPAG